jgi:hypothetical protein
VALGAGCNDSAQRGPSSGSASTSSSGETASNRVSTGNASIDAFNAQIDASTNQALDYLIQDVCVDGADNPIAGDPASCASHRNIRIGEAFPYLVSDYDTATGQTFETVFNYPVPGTDGILKIMRAKNLQQGFTPSFQFSFVPARDGYDLIDTSGSYYSFTRTSDGGCYDQAWQTGPSQATDGWILFAPGLQGGSLVHNIEHVELTSPAPGGCSTSQASGANDIWNPPVQVTYESGKNLSSVIVYHFAAENLSQENNALERNFFTREYGATRWEAWIPLSRCQDPGFAGSPTQQGQPLVCEPTNPASPLYDRCSPNNSPGTTVFGGQTWVRTDCRDTTTYIALNTPVIPLDGPNGTMAQNDGVVSINSSAVYSAQSVENSEIGSIESEVTTAYEQILGRVPDSAGFIAYVNAMENDNWSVAQLDQVFATSAEAQGDLNQLYLNVLGRPIDSGGQSYFTAELANGLMGLAQVRTALATSQEAQNDISQFYQSYLNRAPTALELQNWTNSLALGLTTFSQIDETIQTAGIQQKAGIVAAISILLND